MTPRVLLLGGVDPCGGAGVTADALVIVAHGAWPLPLPVVLTAQNRSGFRAAFAVPFEHWHASLDAVLADGAVNAIKTGLLASAATIAAVAKVLRPFVGRVPIVVDPVLSATAGGLAASAAVATAYREHLLPLATVITPNLPEVEVLFAGDAKAGLALGAQAVLQKGGHGTGVWADDILFTAQSEHRFRRPRLAVGPVHGTGCALASSLAARLGAGEDLPAACQGAGDWLRQRLEALGPAAGDGQLRSMCLAAPFQEL